MSAYRRQDGKIQLEHMTDRELREMNIKQFIEARNATIAKLAEATAVPQQYIQDPDPVTGQTFQKETTMDIGPLDKVSMDQLDPDQMRLRLEAVRQAREMHPHSADVDLVLRDARRVILLVEQGRVELEHTDQSEEATATHYQVGTNSIWCTCGWDAMTGRHRNEPLLAAIRRHLHEANS